jgi:dihydrofolate reductase
MTEEEMRKVIYSMGVSLDGFIEGPDGKFDWAAPNPELHRYFNDVERETGAHLYGRRLYEAMRYWETTDANPNSSAIEVEYARLWQRVPTIVFSITLKRVEGNARLVKGDIAAEVARLKAQPGKDMFLGGAGIGATFMRLGLVDEYWLYVFPVVAGGGKPFFPALDAPVKLHLIETRTLPGDVVLLRYQPAQAA